MRYDHCAQTLFATICIASTLNFCFLILMAPDSGSYRVKIRRSIVRWRDQRAKSSAGWIGQPQSVQSHDILPVCVLPRLRLLSPSTKHAGV